MSVFIFVLGLLTLQGFCSTNHTELATAMVPRGKIFEIYGRDYIVKTPQGTKIEIEFSLDGNFKQASGKNLNLGDNLEPGFGLISLSTVAQKIQDPGIKPKGHWKLELDKELGWIYELNSLYVISAKDGKVLKTFPSSAENISVGISPNYRQNP